MSRRHLRKSGKYTKGLGTVMAKQHRPIADEGTWTCTICGTVYEWGWAEGIGNLNVPVYSDDEGATICDNCAEGLDIDPCDGIW